MTDEKMLMKKPHNVILEDRKNLTITGVQDIDSFDEQMVVAFTDQGELTVRGYNLHVGKIDVESGELYVQGEIESLAYADPQPQRGGGLFGKLFR